MPQFVDHPLPASLVLPRLQAPRPRDKRLDNLQRNGRPKGAQDKITKDLKLGLIEGAVQAGFDGEGTGGLIGYCKWMAMFHPKAYATLLVKLLPYNIHANTESSPTITSVNILSVPSGCHLTQEQMECARQGQPFAIDHEPTPDEPEVQTSEEEELRVIANLKSEINELAQKLGVSVVV
jgi:hypothetical protein